MIVKTIGAGGDYPDIGAALNYLTSVGTLTDNYTFNIISDFIEVTGTPTAPGCVFNGKTVIIQDPNRLYTVTTGSSYLYRPDGPGASILDILIWDGITFKVTNTSVGNFLCSTPWWAANSMTNYYKNLILFGPSPFFSSYAIRNYNRWGNRDYAYNCKIYNFTRGVDFNITDGNTTNGIHLVENCSIYNCGTGIEIGAASASKTGTVKNTVAFNCTKDFLVGNFGFIINCADSDNSISLSGATKLNNITGITSSDFLSVNPLSADFLKLNQIVSLTLPPSLIIGETGSATIGWTCNSKLWKTGTAAISSWNTEDLIGNQRPNDDGSVCIGCYEKSEIVSYSWNLDDGKVSSAHSPSLMYEIIGTKNISVVLTFADLSTENLSGSLNVSGYNIDFVCDNRFGPVKLKSKFEAIFEP